MPACPLRAGQIAAAAGLSTDKAKVEGLRSKLKRLAERGWLADAGPADERPAGVELQMRRKWRNRGYSGLF